MTLTATSTDLAKKYKVNSRHITKLANEGSIPGLKVGRDWRFDEEAVQKALEDKTHQHVRSKMGGSNTLKQPA